MIINTLKDKSVLITGGTRGLGKAIGLEFSRVGAKVFLTHKWGSISEGDLITEFLAQDLPPPRIVESDVGDSEAIRALMGAIQEEVGALDIVISNVSFVKIANDIQDYKRKSFELSLQYSTWPFVDLLQAAHTVTGGFPRYAIAVSSHAPDICFHGYDFAGPSKAALETLCRYLALQLKSSGVRVNAIRPGCIDTASFRATSGDQTVDLLKQRGLLLDPQGAARVCVALCSGWMDAVTGQVIAADEGWSFVNPISYLTGEGLPGEFPENIVGASSDG